MIGFLARVLGRFMFAGIFLAAAASHFQDIKGTGQKIHKSFPAELVGGLDNAVLIAVGLMGGGGFLVATGLLPRLGSLCLIAFLGPATYFVHFLAFKEATSDSQKKEEMIMCMKNAALLGGAFMLFGYECALAAAQPAAPASGKKNKNKSQ
mmetsp:Transcript_21895/g.61225  ORF Transcript_21895/g.61225 Transcript_21895/m.61225 type:complete len:151 (+) Transcript_21895:61-513(+)|eukprot:CAMPEP_0177250820 /NCGR_PEP_ID=MMETSP0367-20130122/53594_1 /TAXON_ID=447022 ORGANISM="Scrippsiella hangoei-like, Strain SHHI-4" /NCGR_SAMPLE_ID=MMETSP0367 /ASSEMBLY_ACC=CAM_ASM_000362 /LENGTH=150 /DNA_ID=CAMNT_0018703627 /DNA_START=58 /DNA_END=510 /DNA_ORIENTATION=+